MLLCLLWMTDPFEQVQLLNPELQQVYDTIVSEEGLVDWRLLSDRKDLQAKLDRYIDACAKVDPIRMNNNLEKIALFSNVYNAWTLQGVLKHYPIESVKDIAPLFGFFRKNHFRFGGKDMSLNDLEKLWIRPLDPRAHFTINCASMSCPRLSKKVFTLENIESEMERLTLIYLKDSEQNRFEQSEKVWYLSKIFDWYERDFGGREAMIAFIQERVPELANFEPKRIHFLDYNWQLNSIPEN